MKRKYLAWILLALSLLAAGCASTQSSEERARLEAERAKARVAYMERIHQAERDTWDVLRDLMPAAADYREQETFGYIGAVFVSEAFYPLELQDAVRAEGLGPYVSALAVADNSPAYEAGLRPGDRLISLNGKRAARGVGAANFALKKVKRLLVPDETNRLEIERDGERLVLEMEAVKAAYYGLVIVPGGEAVIHTDGDAIWMGLGLIESLESDEEIAYVCAYALAQNVMRHAKQKGRNSFLGQLVDVAAAAYGVPTGGLFSGMGQKAHEAGFDVEADLIALYVLASAEFSIDGYRAFWERALVRGSENDLRPVDEQRLEAMAKVIARIREKRMAGEPLFPEEYLAGDTSELE